VGEVAIDSPGVRDAQPIHDYEAQAVDHAADLIGVALRVAEGGALVVLGGPVDAGLPVSSRSPA